MSKENNNMFWQEVKKEEYPFDLRFDIKDINNLYPKLNLDREDILRVLPRKLDSQLYNLKFDGLNTTWRIFLKIKDKKEEDLGLGVYLELIDCRDASETADVPTRNRTSANRKVDHVYAKFSVTLVNNVDANVLSFDAGFHKFDKHEPDWGFAKLFTLDDFWSKKNVYYPDGTLRLRIPLKVLGALTFSGTEPSQEIMDKDIKLAKTLKEDWSELFTSGRESDMKITCGSNVFKVHRVVLSARSPVFRTMLESKMSESKTGNIIIEDLEPETVKTLLSFMYSAISPIPDLSYEELVELVKASDKYGLDELKQLCFPALIRDHLSLTACGDLAVLAYLHGAELSERQAIYDYCHKNWSTLTRDSSFAAVAQSYPRAFFVPE